eukprot:gene4674-8246_t
MELNNEAWDLFSDELKEEKEEAVVDPFKEEDYFRDKQFKMSKSDTMLDFSDVSLCLSTHYDSILRCEVKFQKWRNNKLIQILNFDNQSGIGHYTKILVAFLTNENSLTSLSLCSCSLQPNHAEDFAKILKVNNTLKNLNLSSNKFCKQGIEHLFNSLKINQSLSMLKVGNNHLILNDETYIQECLKENNVLTHLDLSHNLISDLGVEILLDALFDNSSLTELLFSVYLQKPMKEKKEFLLERNKTNHKIVKQFPYISKLHSLKNINFSM